MSALEPYSAEELELLRTDVSYRSLRNGRWFATLKAVARARDAEVRELVEALRRLWEWQRGCRELMDDETAEVVKAVLAKHPVKP